VRNQIYLDSCDHCGKGYYSSYYLDVRAQNKPSYPNLAIRYTFLYTVKQYKSLTATYNQFSLRSDTIDHEFFKVSPTDTQAQRFELEIVGPRGVLVELLSDTCSRTVLKSLRCFKGNLCQLPIPDHRNIQDYSPSRTFYFRITGFDTSFKVRYLKGAEAMVSLTSTEAPFCTGILSQVWGPAEAMHRRDNYASKLYGALQTDFSCAGGCACLPLTDVCLSSLKRYACVFAHRPDDGTGKTTFSSKSECLNIEAVCGKGFASTMYFNHLTCDSASYQNADQRIDPRVNPYPAPAPLIINDAKSLVANGVLMMILIVLLVLLN